MRSTTAKPVIYVKRAMRGMAQWMRVPVRPGIPSGGGPDALRATAHARARHVPHHQVPEPRALAAMKC